MIKTIRAREPVWAELQRLRVELGVRTMEDVLELLLALHRKFGTAPAPGAPDPLMELSGLGKSIWKGIDPDAYVDSLREGW